MSLSIDANERLYDALAEAIDRAGPLHETLLLTKLVLLLANELEDESTFERALQSASTAQ
jgi:hypothetical protein